MKNEYENASSLVIDRIETQADPGMGQRQCECGETLKYQPLRYETFLHEFGVRLIVKEIWAYGCNNEGPVVFHPSVATALEHELQVHLGIQKPRLPALKLPAQKLSQRIRQKLASLR